jgi:hypothetical protein
MVQIEGVFVEILLVLSSAFLRVVNSAKEALCRFIRINKAPPLQNFAAIMTPNCSVISTLPYFSHSHAFGHAHWFSTPRGGCWWLRGGGWQNTQGKNYGERLFIPSVFDDLIVNDLIVRLWCTAHSSLISSTSKQEQNAELQYTEGETNQLFGGPLQLLYKARRWKPFRDPSDVFADVFGSKIPLGAIPRLSVTGR